MTNELTEVLAAWNWTPSVLIGVAVLVCGYLAAVGPWRARATPTGERVSRIRIVAFLLGACAILMPLISPLDELSDQYLFSAHMVQHLLLTLVAPPLLLIGTPGWLLRPLLHHAFIRRVARVLTTPSVAFVLFNGVFMAWHQPGLYEATLRSETIHIAEHLMFIATGILNWWPVLSPLDELPRLSSPVQILYLFLDSVPMTILGALIVFAPAVLYPTYEVAPRILGLSAMADQEIAGLIMWMPGGMIYLLALSIVFYGWFNREERTGQNEPAGYEHAVER